jgi:hypothetical protein
LTFNHGVEGSSPSALTKNTLSSPETSVTGGAPAQRHNFGLWQDERNR